MISRANKSRRFNIRHFDWAEMLVKCIVGLFFGGGGEGRVSTIANKWQFTVFHGIGSDFQIQRKKSKLFFTDALNACNKSIRVQRDMHRAVKELSDISIDVFISKFLRL